MTVKQVLDTIKELKPNQFTDTVLVGWLSDLDKQIWTEIVSGRDIDGVTEPEAYDPVDDLQTELLVPSPYSDVYVKYLALQIDYWMGEGDRYNNSMVLYNLAYTNMASYYSRTYRSKTNTYIYV
jgi:hypothetical protein